MAALNQTENTESQPPQSKDDAKDTNHDANDRNPNSQAKIQDTLQVQFTTKIADKSMQCDDTIYALTSKLRPQALSQVVNHVLNKEDESQRIDFDFLIDNVYIRTPLAQHLAENEISSEQTIIIEYIEKTIEPSAKTNNQHPDWVACVDAIKANMFITGCYDGVVRVWKPTNDAESSQTPLFCQHRAHISPIKGITALYSLNNVYYFASVAKDRSVKVFGLNESTTQMKQVGKIDIKSRHDSHRFTVECCSAPYPSKVFATGSADREIKIYRLRNKDTLDTEGPATKKRKLNVDEMQLNTFMEQDDNEEEDTKRDNKIEWCSLSNISTLRGHRDAVKCLDWSNPLALYSGSWDNGIKLWDVHKEIDSYTWTTQSGVTCLKYWNAQNVLISAHANLKIAIWDPRTDRNISNKSMSEMTFRSHRLPITGVDVDGTAGDTSNKIKNSDYLFVSSSHDGKLKIWDIRSTSPLYTIEKHKGKALCVGWYGNNIVSGGSDCKLHTLKWRK